MKKVCIFTSTRADFGLLSPLIDELTKINDFEVRLFVTGTHLDSQHGYTYHEIQKMGFQAYYQVPLEINRNSGHHLFLFAEAVQSFVKVLSCDLPDIVILLGDRFEALAFALVSNGLGLPICHLHGGEVTEGALDDGYRHCITKLSYLHFTVSDKCRERVICMGESPARVFNVGALAIDNIKKQKLLNIEELSRSLKVPIRLPLAVVTYHPETMSISADRIQLPAMLRSLEKLIIDKNFCVVMTRSNADQGNWWIDEQMVGFSEKFKSNVSYLNSVGMVRYLSLVKQADLVIGNSSSGIYEAPALGTPTINIGHRQHGRDQAVSILNVSLSNQEITINDLSEKISETIEQGVKLKAQLCGKNVSIFGDGQTAQSIKTILQKTHLERFEKKEFYEELAKI